MPRTVPEWIGKTDDTPVPPRVRLRVFDKDDGKCCECGREIRPGDRSETDHITALCNGGENRESNLQTLCGWCHDEKTGADVALKAQVQRTRKKHLGVERKRSGFRGHRKFNGDIVWND